MYEQINKKINVITNLTAIYATQGYGFEHRCTILKRFGFSNQDISKLLNYSVKEVEKGLRYDKKHN